MPVSVRLGPAHGDPHSESKRALRWDEDHGGLSVAKAGHERTQGASMFTWPHRRCLIQKRLLYCVKTGQMSRLDDDGMRDVRRDSHAGYHQPGGKVSG